MTTYWMALGADPDEKEEEDTIIPGPTMLNRNTSTGVESIIEENEDESESTAAGDGGLLDDSSKIGGGLLDDSSKDGTSTTASTKRMLPIRGAPKRRKPPAISMSGLHSFKALRDKKLSKENRLVD